MQTKLHGWAVADPGRRFDDLFNFVYDPATLMMAFARVAGNQGARTPGVDGLRVADIEEYVGVPGFLDDLRASVKDGSFRPLPVRERKIPKPGGSGKLRKLGIPTVADRVVQAALKLVVEPIFEADFLPWRARCREIGTAGSASGPGNETGGNTDTVPRADSTGAPSQDRRVLGLHAKPDRRCVVPAEYPWSR